MEEKVESLEGQAIPGEGVWVVAGFDSFFKKSHVENLILEMLNLLLYGHKLEMKTQRQRPAREVCLLLLLAPVLWSLKLSQPTTLLGDS